MENIYDNYNSYLGKDEEDFISKLLLRDIYLGLNKVKLSIGI